MDFWYIFKAVENAVHIFVYYQPNLFLTYTYNAGMSVFLIRLDVAAL